MKSQKLNFEIFQTEKLSKNEQKSILGGDQQEIHPDPVKEKDRNGYP